MNTKPTVKNFLIVIFSAILVLFVIFFLILPAVRENGEKSNFNGDEVKNFEECVSLGNSVIESDPRQCRNEGVTFTEEITSQISRDEAVKIAGQSKDCTMAGILTDKITYNAITKTWWIDLERTSELEKDGCNPACVVSEQTQTAEVNWRCTGAMLPESTECLPEQRNVDACTGIYQPVCATVQVQCITTPCNPIQETFSNFCFACQNSLVSSYIEGKCE